MSEHFMSSSDLLALWLDGKLTPEQRAEFEQRCASDSAFAAQVETANWARQQAEDFVAAPVPNWQRENTFIEHNTSRWWQSPVWSWTSMAASAFAVMLVVSGVQFRYTDQGLVVSNQPAISEQQIDALVDKKISAATSAQQQSMQLALQQYSNALNEQQSERNLELTRYLLNSSRQERKEDFAELIQFINQQRQDDQFFFARQINQLQQQMYAQPDESVLPQTQE